MAAKVPRNGSLSPAKLARLIKGTVKERRAAFISGKSTGRAWKKLPVGSPLRWLPLVGTMTRKEAEQIMANIEDLEKV